MSWRHGGNIRRLAQEMGRAAAEILDFSANINPLGPPEWLPELINSLIGSLVHYPDPHCTGLVKAVAETYGLREEEIVIGNGSSELLYLLPRVLETRRALIPVPAYGDYAVAAALAGWPVEKLPLQEKDHFALNLAELEARLQGDDAVFLGQPANPTGLLCRTEELRALAARHPGATFVIDEAFADFTDEPDRLLLWRPANVVVLCSLTKFYAIPGLRLGYAVAGEKIAARMRELIPAWSVNTLAQAVGEKALHDWDYAKRSRQAVATLREQLAAGLSKIGGLAVYPGRANFLLLRVDSAGLTARQIAGRLLREGIAVRVCDNFAGLDGRFFRVAVRREEENRRLYEALAGIMRPSWTDPVVRGDEAIMQAIAPGNERPDKSGISNLTPAEFLDSRRRGSDTFDVHGARSNKTAGKVRPRPAIMFQGTCSHAGKSILAAAICRILLQDGYRVAPFKAQNMSLNSFVTPEGGEIGRAQAVQAQACRVEPDVRMNPLLLKPSTDTGSQVIVLGKAVGNMDFTQYARRHEQYLATARQAYDSLSQEYDVMVLEGAGSPAEVNLLSHDIANMKTARYAGAPVLLVGNIDRGGVYASFVGTMDVLPKADRSLIAGFVVNRFRGTAALLDDAHEFVARRTGRSVFGVVPEIANLGLPEEDSVGFRDGRFAGIKNNESGDGVEIAVLDFAHISNFTDLDPLRMEADVRVRIVRTLADLGTPDAVILPGSKNVVADLTFLLDSGLGAELLSLLRAGRTEIIGLCGGFQMLGEEIADPHGIESAGKTIRGLGLLPLRTVLEPEKLLQRTSARHLASGLEVSGYEIHHGRTVGAEGLPWMKKEDGEPVGTADAAGRVWGTYLHGVFDADGFRRWFVDRLRTRRGLASLGRGAVYDLEPAFDRLAEVVRRSIDLDRLYRVMGLR